MQEMGWKPKKSEGPQVAESAPEPKMQYPRMYIERNVPSELMDKDVGNICRLEIVAKVVSKSIDERDENKSERCELEIHKLGYIGKAGKMSKEEYLKASDEEREKNDRENISEEEEGEE